MRHINYANSWLMGIDPVATGRQLKKLRRQHNFTQEDLSELFEWCDMSASRVSISVWENGKKTPSLLHIVFLAELYGCTLDELVVSYRRSHERELEDRDQPVPLINIITFKTNVCVCICSSFLFCKLAVSVNLLSNQYNKIIDFRGGLSHENIRRSCFPGRSF